MRLRSFSLRCFREILRDPLNLAFGLGFPLVVLLLLTAIQQNIPVSLFELEKLTPGITVFGLSFMTLFSAMILAKDRTTSFLQRLYTTPLTALDFMLGYTLPLLPISLAQGLICYLVALSLGLGWTVHIFTALLCLLPVALFYVSLGLLCGSIFNDKQVGGICGALLTNLSAWLSGIWFDLDLVGGAFKAVADVLPFAHAVKLEQAAYAGDLSGILPHLWVVLAYGIGTLALAILAFLRQRAKQ